MNWQEVCEHPSLQDLPFKLETDEWGRIVMSPASNKHGAYQARLVRLFFELAAGEVVTECSIDTFKGTKVADVAWCSASFVAKHGLVTPYPEAPDVCVEILSPSNTMEEMQEKILLYLAKGAEEVWLCEDDGRVRFFGHAGERSASEVIPAFPTSIA